MALSLLELDSLSSDSEIITIGWFFDSGLLNIENLKFFVVSPESIGVATTKNCVLTNASHTGMYSWDCFACKRMRSKGEEITSFALAVPASPMAARRDVRSFFISVPVH